jgi:hypothetical protein
MHSCGRSTAQEIAKVFNNCHQAAFTGGSGEACCCSFYATVDAYHTINPENVETSPQCEGEHSAVCHDVLFLQFQLL